MSIPLCFFESCFFFCLESKVYRDENVLELSSSDDYTIGESSWSSSAFQSHFVLDLHVLRIYMTLYEYKNERSKQSALYILYLL